MLAKGIQASCKFKERGVSMKKNMVVKHIYTENKVASLYIEETYLKNEISNEYFCTSYYDYISVVVSKSRRTNNDWYNGKKTKLDNKITGGTKTFLLIGNALKNHIDNFISHYDYYCCKIEPSDKRRAQIYEKMLIHYANRNNLNMYKLTEDELSFVYYIE
jgi:hypothetical protein